MDVGVGSFVFAAALTSSQSRPQSLILATKSTFVSTLKKLSPLLLIGFIRVITVKTTDYQVINYFHKIQ